MSASPEFTALCRSQVTVLTQGLGASLSVVYLTEDFTEGEETKLVPVVAYPEVVATWSKEQILALLSRGRSTGLRPPNTDLQFLLPEASEAEIQANIAALPSYSNRPEVASPRSPLIPKPSSPPQQIVLPLVHDEMVMGFLVTARPDRPWSDQEQDQIGEIAETITLACILDQRSQWIEQDFQQQQLLRAEQHDILDDLLHQFRNPLTALRTFGKLLLKRLVAEDGNRTVAEGIVRESDRLQDLLKQFDVAIDLGEADLLPPSLDAIAHRVESNLDQATGDSSPRSALLLPGNPLTGMPLQLEPHTLNEILGPLLVSAEAIAQDRQLTLITQIPAGLPPVRVDLRALQEVLNNLIDNALKYTPADGYILVQAGPQQATQQAVLIADTGPGIPPQDLERVFERHYRGRQAETEIPGSGLGMAIAHDLIQQMQGEIEVFSPAQESPLVKAGDRVAEGQGPGTAVVVWLPLFS